MSAAISSLTQRTLNQAGALAAQSAATYEQMERDLDNPLEDGPDGQTAGLLDLAISQAVCARAALDEGIAQMVTFQRIRHLEGRS